MKRLAALGAFLLVAVAGCGSERQPTAKPFAPKAGDIKLPALPAQGLAVNKSQGVELMGLDGRRYGLLPGFKADYSGFTRFIPLDPNRSRLSGRGKSYLLDAANGYLLLAKRNSADLGYGFEFRDISIWKLTDADKQVAALDNPDETNDRREEIYRDGKPFLWLGGYGGDVALTREADFITVSSWGSSDKTRLIDLSSGSSEPIPSGCIVYGRRAGVLNALCTKGEKSGLSTLSLRRKNGDSWPVVFAWPKVEGEWQGGVLSPDGRHLVVTRGIPCDTDTAEIVDAQGPKRKLLGEGTALGWSVSGKAIVYLREKVSLGCDTRAPYSGAVYAVDPVTLKRTLIVKTSAAKFWSKAKA